MSNWTVSVDDNWCSGHYGPTFNKGMNVMAGQVAVSQDGNRYNAIVKDYRRAGDEVRISREGYDVHASYVPPADLTSALPSAPEFIALEEIAKIAEENPEVGLDFGFSIALMLGTYSTEELTHETVPMNMTAGLVSALKNGDEAGVNAMCDRLKAMGLYK